jgi:non-ribosomal peptide synthetase component E (peptide arylation enzyme)
LNWPVQRWPDKVAIICQDERLTFAQMNDRVNRLANSADFLRSSPPSDL